MKKIIIAEDILESLQKEHTFLQREQIKLYPASTNRIALYTHEAEQADLIITKIDTDAMTAEELCETIRRDPSMKNVSIIVVTYGRESDEERARKCNANAFITLPINPVLLLGHAKKLISVPTRMNYRVPVSVKVEGASGDDAFLGYTENISASGMLIGTDSELSRDRVIQCSFFLPNSSRIAAQGKVVRSIKKVREHDPFKYGIQFSEMEDDLKADIELFVDQQKKLKD